ncbi:unnamed protein product [Prorocentrum cordatum]|uniref:Uncharacterized protein n=1 Tax=Prorocentrum cordatum TaxID=2364126 RepID=A0ABN9PEG0_9DINO|nr:unnamed protein product [Polarella glacialis]
MQASSGLKGTSVGLCGLRRRHQRRNTEVYFIELFLIALGWCMGARLDFLVPYQYVGGDLGLRIHEFVRRGEWDNVVLDTETLVLRATAPLTGTIPMPPAPPSPAFRPIKMLKRWKKISPEMQVSDAKEQKKTFVLSHTAHKRRKRKDKFAKVRDGTTEGSGERPGPRGCVEYFIGDLSINGDGDGDHG